MGNHPYDQRLSFTFAGRRVCVLATLMAATLLVPAGLTAQGPATRPTAQRPESLWVLAADYRRFRRDPAKREAAAKQLLARGAEGAVQLQEELQKELQLGYARYQRDFYAQAQSLGLQKYRAANKQHIAAWQAHVQALGNDEDLSKDAIKTRGEPALTNLRKALTFSSADVLASSPALAAQREAVIGLLALQDKCFAVRDAGKVVPPRPDRTKTIVQDETILAMMGAPLGTNNRRIVEDTWRRRGDLLPEEAHGLIDLNVMRSLVGLEALVLDLQLCKAGRGHSTDMVERKFFSHTSPVPGKKAPVDRARLAGATLSALGECIAYGQRTAAQANAGWFLSPSHHKLILGNFTRAGLGRHKNYWTLMVSR